MTGRAPDLFSAAWPFGALVPGAYRCIIADPPWRFVTYSARGLRKSPQAHYDCMSLDAIKALPVRALAAPDCLLWLWGTAPMVPAALAVMEAWGFAFVTQGGWAKQSRTGRCWHMGPGYRLRSAQEPYFIGAIGRPAQNARNIRNLIVAPVREHSRKPDQARRDCEAMADGPRAELFARETVPGWDAWGNEMGKLDAIAR